MGWSHERNSGKYKGRLRRHVRFLNVVGEPPRKARPRPPRDGGSLPETGLPGGERPHRRRLPGGDVGDHSRRRPPPCRRSREHRTLGRHEELLADCRLFAPLRRAHSGNRICLDLPQPTPFPRCRRILLRTPRGMRQLRLITASFPKGVPGAGIPPERGQSYSRTWYHAVESRMAARVSGA